MVRAIVGTLIHVGRGRWKPQDVRRILQTGDRSHAGETAPPQGLYLINTGLQHGDLLVNPCQRERLQQERQANDGNGERDASPGQAFDSTSLPTGAGLVLRM